MKNKIQSEFSGQQNEYLFKKKNQKFLHNIDTFYYSVTFQNDFSDTDVISDDESVNKFVRLFNNYAASFANVNQYDGFISFELPNCDYNLLYSRKGYAGFYNHCVSVPDTFDCYITTKVPNLDTASIIVQIRSGALWKLGAKKAFDYSFKFIQCLVDYINSFNEGYSLIISDVKENRVDYAYHTNYLSNPETYLRIDNFSKMQVSSFRRITYQYQFDSNDEYENDYVALGKRGDKCFVRMYLKSKEVVEQGYKSFFIGLWYYNGLINYYDKYVLENLYELRNWKLKDIIRLQFYYDYGSDPDYKEKCYHAMESYFVKGQCNYDYISKLADLLTPKITTVMNIEFQTMRKMSKSFCLIDHGRNSGDCKRIYDYLDNHALIVDYLTYYTLRLVNRNTALKKSDCELTAFWEALRRTRLIDVRKTKNKEKLHREYSRNHDYNLMKNRFIHTAVNLSIYANGTDYNKDLINTVADTLCLLNDNDVRKANNYRLKTSKRFGQDYKGELSGVYRE